jgi:large subunit ribosomal protein L28
MSRICKITGKKPSVGRSVSHSHRRTLRKFSPNLMKKKVFNPETGKFETMVISAKGLRTIQRKMK